MNTMDNKLHMRCLGGFSLTYNGESLLREEKSQETHFIYILQLLLHNLKKGVDRNQIEQIIFGDRDVQDIHHSTQSLIYSIKKKLKKLGLPECNYITLERGIFYWTPEIEVVEDAASFAEIVEQARIEEDEETAGMLYHQACYMYRGEFIPRQSSMIWVAAEARMYKELFRECVENAAQYLRNRKEMNKLESLGAYACRVDSFSNWEALQMEACMKMGHFRRATDLYENTVDQYMAEGGMNPSHQIRDLMVQMNSLMENEYSVLDDIQQALTTGLVEAGNRCYRSYPVFQGVYNAIQRMVEDHVLTAKLMLCTIVDSKGNPMQESRAQRELSARLKEAIDKTIRHSDHALQYSPGQHLILFTRVTDENCASIQKRINKAFLSNRQSTGVQYHVSDILVQPRVQVPLEIAEKERTDHGV